MKKILFITVGLLFAPLAFCASTNNFAISSMNKFSWDYADIAVATHDYDGGSNVTTFSGDFSYAMTPNFYLLGGAGYGWTSNVNLYDVHGGLGYHWSVIHHMDVFGEAQIDFTHNEYDNTNFTTDDNGYKVRAGVRYRLNQNVELKGGVYHADVISTDSGAFASALYHFGKRTGFGVRAKLGNHETAVGLFARFDFW